VNKQTLIESVAKELCISNAQGDKAINAVLNGISKGLKKDKNVQLVGFGTFLVRTRKARKGRNRSREKRSRLRPLKRLGLG